MTLISVIVPVYNVEDYIYKCVESILLQTYSNLEIVLVNDGSQDRSGEICDEFSRKDNRIIVIHKENGGLADARNAGLDKAKGDYISFIDSDDFIENDMYEKMITACELENADISVCGRFDIYDSEIESRFSFEGKEIWTNKEAIRNLLTWNNIDSSACDKLYKKELFHKIRFPFGKYNEDIFMMVKILDQANKIVHIGKSKYYYNHRAGSITTMTFSNKNLDMLEASENVMNYTLDVYPDLSKEAENFYSKNLIYLLYTLLDTTATTITLAEYKLAYKKLRKQLSYYVGKIIKSKNFNARDKIFVCLIATNTFLPLRKTKKFMAKNIKYFNNIIKD